MKNKKKVYYIKNPATGEKDIKVTESFDEDIVKREKKKFPIMDLWNDLP